MYDSPRDTGPQLSKFLAILAQHRQQLEEQMADLQANLDEVKTHEKEARALLAQASTKAEPAGIIDVYVNVNSAPSAMAACRFQARRSRTTPSRVRASFERQGAMQTIGASLARVEPGRSSIELPWAPAR